MTFENFLNTLIFGRCLQEPNLHFVLYAILRNIEAKKALEILTTPVLNEKLSFAAFKTLRMS